MRIGLMAVMAGIIGSMAVSCARADVIETGSFIGTVSGGSDPMALFGAQGAAVGAAVYGTISIDLSAFSIVDTGYANDTGISGNAITVTFDIGGSSFTQTGNSQASYSASYPYTTTSSVAYSVTKYLTASTGVGTGISLPVSIPGNSSLDKVFATLSGSMNINEFTNNGNSSTNLLITLSDFELGGTPLAAPTVAVPEPGSAVAFGSGIGGLVLCMLFARIRAWRRAPTSPSIPREAVA